MQGKKIRNTTALWLALLMLTMSVTACGGNSGKAAGDSSGSGGAAETLSADDQETAKRLAELDRAIKEAVEGKDYGKALSMKEEMLELAGKLGLTSEYQVIADRLDELAGDAPASEGEGASTGAAAVAETAAASAAPAGLALGEPIQTPFAEIKLDSFQFTENVQKSVKTGSFTRITGPAPVEGTYYALAEGTIKNLTKTELPVYDFFIGTLDVNGYTYQLGSINCDILDERGQTVSNIGPLISYDLRIYVTVPAELANSPETAALSLGFYENFDNTELSRNRGDADALAKCTYSYTYNLLSYGTDNAASEPGGNPDAAAGSAEAGGNAAAGAVSDGGGGANSGNETAASGMPILALGDKVTTDDFEFTLNKVEFTYELLPEDTSSTYISYTPANDKVYLHIDGSFYNKAKRDYCVRDLPQPGADYDNGFAYSGFPIVDNPGNRSSFTWVSSYVACTPLETAHYHGLVECPKIVEASEAPLFVTLKMPDGKTYRCDVR